MEPAIRAAVSLPIINAMINRAPFAPLPNSTLNQKYNMKVFANGTVQDVKPPVFELYCK